MIKSKTIKWINSFCLALVVVTLMLVSVTKIKADSVQAIQFEGIKLFVKEKEVGSSIEITIHGETIDDLELDSITYKDDSYFFSNNTLKLRIKVNDEEQLKLKSTRRVLSDSKLIVREESFQFKTNLMDQITSSLGETEGSLEKNTNVLRLLDSIPDIEQLDSVLKDNEYININQENGAIEVLQSESLPFFEKRKVKQVKTGAKISSNVNFHWGANESFAWQFPGGFSEISVDDLIAYCLEPSVMLTETKQAISTRIRDLSRIRIMDGRLYTTLSKNQIDKIELIASYGFQYPGHNTKSYRWATQVLIFETIGWVFDSYGAASVNNEMREIERLIELHTRKPVWNAKTLSYVPGSVVDLSDKYLEGYTINFNKTKNLEIITFKSNELIVKPNNDNAVVELVKISSSTIGDSDTYSDGSSQKVGTLKLPEEVRINAKFKAKPGTLNVTKSDEDGLKYEGVVFEISKNKLDTLTTITTNANGMATFGNMEPGTYFIKEQSVPSPLVIDNKWYQFTITSDKVTEYNAINAKVVGEIDVLKTDDNGNPLFGVIFELKDESSQIIKTLSSNKEGKLKFEKLPLGKYTLTETKVNEPFVIDTSPIEIELKYYDSGTPVVSEFVHIENKTAKGKILIHKISNEGANIEGAIFEIRDESMNLVDKLITLEDGRAISKALNLGKYKIFEVYVPKPFVLDTIEHEVELEYVNQNTELVLKPLTLTNYPQRVELEVIKKEDNTDSIFTEMHGKEISGTEFGLYSVVEDGLVLIEKGITNLEGKLTFEDIDLGKYLVRELNPSNGYQPNLNDITVDFEFDELEYTSPIVFKQIVVENSPLQGKAKLIKENDEGNLLEGVVYDLYTIESRKIARLTTNSFGEIETPLLRYGKYYLQEVQTVNGHELNEEKILFTIHSSTETLYLNAINKVHKANIKILKVDSITHEPLSGAHFKIKNLDTGRFFSYVEIVENKAITKDEWISDENGYVSLTHPLSYGNYILIETKPPIGYKAGVEVNFSIDENQNYEIDDFGRTLNLVVENVKNKYDIEIRKTDAKTNTVIQGVRFALFSKNNVSIDSLKKGIIKIYDRNNNLIRNAFSAGIEADAIGITNEVGTLSFEGLNLDDYYIVEMDAPYGYEISSKIESITKDKLLSLPNESKTLNMNLKNNRSKVRIVVSKKDSFTLEKLTGVDYVLDLFNFNNVKVKLDEFSRGEHIWIVDALETYYLRESVAPKGYKLSNEIISVNTFEKSNGVYEIDFFNDVMFEDVLPYTGVININYYAYYLVGFGLVLALIGYGIKKFRN